MGRAARVVVIGGGVGGLVTAGCLARAGLDVTLLEAHIYVGGCAGTFFHRGYRFDAGATLTAGFYPGGPFDLVGKRLGVSWKPRPADVAMVYHGPCGSSLPRQTCPDAWREARVRAFGADGERFWRWQEETADALWALALERPPWPPSRVPDLFDLGHAALQALPSRAATLPSLAVDAFRPVASRLTGSGTTCGCSSTHSYSSPRRRRASERRRFTARRRSTYLGEASSTSREAWPASSSQWPTPCVPTAERSLLRREATRIVFCGNRPVAVQTKQGEAHPADVVVVNLPAPDAYRLMGENAPGLFGATKVRPRDGWGAFVTYVGLDSTDLPRNLPIHHQIVLGRPLGEGRSVFLSLSLADDQTRAPAGHRAATLSTHTRLDPWWELHKSGRAACEARNEEFADELMAVADQAIPGFRRAARLVLPGSPIDFARFTHRVDGWVGGYPQTSLLRSLRPGIAPGLWLVGDSIFPGQSTPAVALGGLRVADQILRQER